MSSNSSNHYFTTQNKEAIQALLKEKKEIHFSSRPEFRSQESHALLPKVQKVGLPQNAVSDFASSREEGFQAFKEKSSRTGGLMKKELKLGLRGVQQGARSFREKWGEENEEINQLNQIYEKSKKIVATPGKVKSTAKTSVRAGKQTVRGVKWTANKVNKGFQFLRNRGFTMAASSSTGAATAGTGAGVGALATGTGEAVGTAGTTAAVAGGEAAGGWIPTLILLGIVIVMMILVLLFGGGANAQDSSNGLTGNAERIYQWFKQKDSKATNAGIAGVLGSWEIESHFNPAAIQSGLAYNDSWAKNGTIKGYAFGVAQWDATRRVDLLNYAASQNKPWDDLETQLEFAWSHDGTNSDLLKQIVEETGTPEQAATDFLNLWERGAPGSLGERVANAQSLYQEMTSVGGSVSALKSMVGQSVGNGQCYGLASYYVNKMTGGKYSLGAGIGGTILSNNGDMGPAKDIGSAYDWSSIGWSVTPHPSYDDIKPGDIITELPPLAADAELGHVEIVDQLLGHNQIRVYSQNPGPIQNFTITYSAGAIVAAIHPSGK